MSLMVKANNRESTTVRPICVRLQPGTDVPSNSKSSWAHSGVEKNQTLIGILDQLIVVHHPATPRPSMNWRRIRMRNCLPAATAEQLPFHAITLVALLLTTASTYGQDFQGSIAAFQEGRFLEAADVYEAMGTSEGYAAAARSLAIHAHYKEAKRDREPYLNRAMDLVHRAIAADSMNADAYLEAAHVAGREAQSVGTLTALRKGFAGKIRDYLESALQADPDHLTSHLALGGWHADIASAGRIARMMYGGTYDQAIQHFERAMELAPESKTVMFEYGSRLAVLDRANGRDRARAMLSKAAAVPVVDAYEQLIQDEITAALAALDDNE